MNQAARSGKQNIIEGVGARRTSATSEIKLLGVANASFEELLTDYEDFLRQNNFKIYLLADPKISQFRELSFHLSHLSNLGDLKEKPKLFYKPEEDANFLLTLCHQETYLLSRQIKAAEDNFIQGGGYNESLAKKRRDFRGY